MHEYGIVAELVNQLTVQLQQAKVSQVEYIHLQRGVDFYEDSLRDAFAAYSVGTPLEGAKLIVETATVSIRCACGTQGYFSVEKLQGRFWVCHRCGKLHAVENIPDLEVLEVVVKT
jgi:Zn finger protein HypA/HybF involved in hydrogenase expression